jgi:hypothetical protein
MKPFISILVCSICVVASTGCSKQEHPSSAAQSDTLKPPVVVVEHEASTPLSSPLAFSKADRACVNRSECRASLSMYLKGEVCCHSCNYNVVNKEAAVRVKSQCAALGSEGCPMKKCAAPPTFDCIEGVCVASER